MTDFIEAIRRVMRRVREYLYGYGSYAAPWRWDRRCQRWVYGPSEGTGNKGYNCTEYVIARIEGRPPMWGVDSYATTETDEIVDRLGRLGWQRREPACNCGCGPGQTRDCVVLYVQDGMIFHAAIFDHTHCDWGGKLSATGPIARFRRPEDYLLYCGETPPRTEMWFFCPRTGTGSGTVTAPTAGQQKTDDWLHTNATSQQIFLECPSAVRLTVTATATRYAWRRRSARLAARAAATAAGTTRINGSIALHTCAGSCTKSVARPGGNVTNLVYAPRALSNAWQWGCTATYVEVATINCR